MRVFIAALLFLIPISLYASARPNSGGLAARVAELEAEVAELSAVLQFVYIEEEEINNLAGPHLIIEGANVHVRSGSGGTGDGCNADFPNCESLTGLGNLIVGYNKLRGCRGVCDVRTGSHNLVVGDEHQYPGWGGFVAGGSNSVTHAFASVCGGTLNRARGFGSSVCGGQVNEAIGHSSSVSGGQRRSAENLPDMAVSLHIIAVALPDDRVAAPP